MMLKTIKNKFGKRVRNVLTGSWQLSRRLKRETCGAAAIEAAFIFPVMMLLYVGMVDVSTALSVSRKLTITTNIMGDLVSQEPGVTSKQNLAGMFAGAGQVMAPYDATKMSVHIYAYKPNEDGNPELTWDWKSAGPICGGAPPPADNEMKKLMAQGNDIYITRSCLELTPTLGQIMGNNVIKLKREMTLRPRKSLHVDCENCTQH